MEHIISKMSSYELINYLFLGGLSFIIGILLNITFFLNVKKLFDSLDSVIQIASYLIFIYFLGILISRGGSFLEYLSKKIKLIEYSPYKDYIKAEKLDSKIPILLAQANLYRSLMGMFILFIIITLGTKVVKYFITLSNYSLILFILIIVFFFSWRKQVNYIKRRVAKAIEQESTEE